MKTDIDIKDEVYMLLKESALADTITGVVSKTLRPANSRKEDVVISVLANNNTRPQSAYVNVNVYVPDLAVKYQVEEQTVTQYEEDSARLREICNLCKDLFDTYVGDTYRITLDSQRVLSSADDGAHIVNNKLLYQNY